MRRWIALLLIFASFPLFASEGSGNSAETADGVGKLIFDPVWHDFGEIPDNQTFPHRFTFTVKGAPVTIKKLETSCGCTTTALEKYDYLPGEQGTIEVVVDTTGFNGLIYKTILVEVEGGETSELALMAQVVRGKGASVLGSCGPDYVSNEQSLKDEQKVK